MGNIAEEKAIEIIDFQVEQFMRYIRKIARSHNKKNFAKTYIYPALEPDNNMFYLYENYDVKLEEAIRIGLVADVFRSLVKELDDPDVSIKPVPDECCSTFVINGRRINDYGMEFFLDFRGERFAICCTDLYFDKCFEVANCNNYIKSIAKRTRIVAGEWRELHKLYGFLHRYGVKNMLLIEWNDKNAEKPSQKHIVYRFGQRITMKKLYEKFFSAHLYELYYNKVEEAIDKASKEIGIQIIPQMSLNNLFDFRLNKIKEYANLDCIGLMNKVMNEKKAIVEKQRLSNEELDYIDRNFKDKKLYLSLVGNKIFAKSFIASEYMYSIFEKGGEFEYTCIVVGYLKSIEQLMKLLVENTRYDERLYMTTWLTKAIIKEKHYQIKNGDFKDSSDFTENSKCQKRFNRIKYLKNYKNFFVDNGGAYLYFLKENKGGWGNKISSIGLEAIFEYVKRYINDDRNEHLHIDNITDFEEVRKIRNDTLLIMYLLLGGYQGYALNSNERDIFGIVDDEFDRLYCVITNIAMYKGTFIIQYKDGTRVHVKQDFQDIPEYDSNGSLSSDNV